MTQFPGKKRAVTTIVTAQNKGPISPNDEGSRFMRPLLLRHLQKQNPQLALNQDLWHQHHDQRIQ